VLIGHDWGAMGAYSGAALAPDNWRRVVAAAVPPGPVVAGAVMSYDQLRLSWYMFFQLTPIADLVVPADDFEFISRLWADWSPGYDAAADVANFVACMDGPGRVEAALGYYRQTLQPELQDPALDAAQAAAYGLPPQPLLYLHGRTDGCMRIEDLRFGHDGAGEPRGDDRRRRALPAPGAPRRGQRGDPGVPRRVRRPGASVRTARQSGRRSDPSSPMVTSPSDSSEATTAASWAPTSAAPSGPLANAASSRPRA
jgi:pimeloyl-ACP methyl ester carboxylesterase